YAGGRVTPYRGWMQWHHITGLLGGVIILTFVFSGWMSMGPNGWGGPGQNVLSGRSAWTAASKTPYPLDLAALRTAQPGFDHEAQFYWLGDRPLMLAFDGAGGRRLLDPRTAQHVIFSDAELFERAATLVPGSKMVMRDRLTEDDAYWYSHHNKRPLPILRAGFDDAASSWFYIDPSTARMAGVADNSLRLYRWTFSALHSLDFKFLLNHRPLWDLLIWSLSILGLIVSVSGVVIGWRRVAADVRRAQKKRALA
ncbi:MAG: hypothetical protein ABW063_14805, partial [Caulobacter sp.]